MGRDQHGPPPGLSEEELRRWKQARRFVWGPGDIVILKEGGARKVEQDASKGWDDERLGRAGAR